MLPQQVMVNHTDRFQELPQRWTRHWRTVLSRQAQAVYLYLRHPIFDGEMISVRVLAAELVLSVGALERALEELQRWGFVALEEGLD